MLKRNERAVMAAPSRFGKRMVNAYSGACYQCHLTLIWKTRSIGYWGKDGLRRYGDPDIELKRACCHGGSESLRQANGLVIPSSGASYQCHINMI